MNKKEYLLDTVVGVIFWSIVSFIIYMFNGLSVPKALILLISVVISNLLLGGFYGKTLNFFRRIFKCRI